MTIADQIRQEGEVKGRRERDRELAARLLARGLPESEVAELTDLSLEEVAAIAQKTAPRSDRVH